MSTTTSCRTILALTAFVLAVPLFLPVPASAGSQHLSCNSPYKKVQTYANSIKCKWAHSYPLRRSAEERARQLRSAAGCNAHSNAPTVEVWKKQGNWAVRATFICANIT